MSLAILYSRARLGIEAPLVTVEVHLANGLPSMAIVGMPETAVKESRDRVRSAIINSHFEFPAKRITINLAPADLPKHGGQFDLAIALGILAASGQIPNGQLTQYELLGELALSGEVRPITGCLPAALACQKAGRQLICPNQNAAEATLVDSIHTNPSSQGTPLLAGSLLEVCHFLHGQGELPLSQSASDQEEEPAITAELQDVKGQQQAKRALEIAAAGEHHLLFYGPPGTGKSMLASRLTSILPPLSRQQQIEVACIHSVAKGHLAAKSHIHRPFTAPHHSASAAALVGGGTHPKPGEISLAHRGVLFLDELPEFQRSVLEVLREPLENGHIRISRANAQVEYPARFQLIAAMNPCPCGYWGQSRCRCNIDQVQRYQGKISGPLLDRIDLHVPVTALKQGELYASSTGDSSAQVRARVVAAQARQITRQGHCNSQLSAAELEQHCPLTPHQQQLLEQAMAKLGLSARALHRIMKVARTIADLSDMEAIKDEHLHEALSYRGLQRSN